jgi:succinyl-diaminopimelate desuccinylase
MSDPVVSKIQDWLRAHEAELLTEYQNMLRIPSVEGPAVPNGPYGQANRDALDLALGLGAKWGMKTEDLEGKVGYAEFGSGKKLVTILGHLDVVPVGPGWKHDPFSATIDNGYVYSRGATDDKGPTIAAFFAARAIMEICPDISARIRTVFGCDEESGFGCITRYCETEEIPTYGIAPDASWPLIHAEKGIANMTVTVKRFGAPMEIVSLTGGQAHNIVIDSAVGVAKIDASVRAEIDEKLAKSWDANLSYAWDGDLLTVTAKGKAAHGSWPWGGDNAALRILRFWMEIAPAQCKTAFEDLFETGHIGGVGLGIQGADDMSDLTVNLGIVKTSGDVLELLFNIRYPVTWDGATVENRAKEFVSNLNGTYVVSSFTDSKPLYFPLEHPLVKTVCEVYEAETGEKKKPGVMGGGTYARAIPNTVAIGGGFQGDGDAHQTDERLKVDHLYKMSRMYAHVIYKLAMLPD